MIQLTEITRRTPKQRRSKQTRDVILEAAAQILVEDQSLFSTNHIAKRAGVSVGSLYQYFATKEDIVSALLTQQMNTEFELFQIAFAKHEGGDLEAIVTSVITAIINSHRQDLNLRLALQQLASLPSGTCSLEGHAQKIIELVVSQLQKLHKQMTPNLDIPFAATLICKSVEGIIVHLMRYEPERLHQSDTIAAITQLIYGYLAYKKERIDND